MTWDEVCRFVATLPGAEVDPATENPAIRVRGRVMARLRRDGESMMVKTDPGEREALLAGQPETFFTTPHYDGFPGVLVRLAGADPQQLRELLVEAWRQRASKKMVREREGDG
jgi:hypothetical protein